MPGGRGAVSARVVAALSRRWFELVLFALALIGCLLRFVGLSRQVVLGDEWHALIRASSSSVVTTLTTYIARATSIPNNVYLRILLETCGWTELGTRMPSILATLGTFVLLPRIVYRRLGSRLAAIVSTGLFAISNFWIFYGQNARPYAPFFLLLLATLDCFEEALVTGRLRSWAWFALWAALGVYFHLYMLPAAAPLCLLALVHQLWRARAMRESPALIIKRILRIGFGFALWACLLLALFAAPLKNGMLGEFPPTGLQMNFDRSFFRATVESLTGTAHTWVAWLLFAGSLLGVAFALPRRPLFISALLATCLGSVAFMLKQAPYGGDNAFVMLRYNLAVYLLYFVGAGALCMLLARALGRVLTGRTRFGQPWAASALTGTSFLLFCSFVSTLARDVQAIPNNFRQHAAFHEFLGRHRRDVIQLSDDYEAKEPTRIPSYYATLAALPKPCAIVEYPLAIGDDQEPYYFYQLTHGCEVFAGYSNRDTLGEALGAEQNASKLRFRQLINIEHAGDVSETGARYLLVHKNRTAEFRALQPGIGKLRARQEKTWNSELGRVLRELKRSYGAPVYSDPLIEVFDLGRARSSP